MRRLLSFLKRSSWYFLWAVLGFVVGAAALYIHTVRSGPPLEIWHTGKLTGEFTAERADEVRSFDDYLRLEDALFAELEEKIYGNTATGPAYTLVRYSAGSASDPLRWERNWNRSFELSSDAPAGGVLLLHGMSDGPYSFRALGEALNRQGYWVVGLRMPGHGTAPSGLRTITVEDMAAAVRFGVEHLTDKVGEAPIHLMGYSTGAPLALDYALSILEGAEGPLPASLVLVSPAIAIHPAAALAGWKDSLARLPGLEKLAWTQILPEFDPFRYNSFTSNAGDLVHRLTRSVKGRIEARAASGPMKDFPPTLVLLSTADATVDTDAVVDNLLEHLAPGRHELVLFDINYTNVKSTLLVDDPRPLTERLMASDTLPFALTLITNENPDSSKVIVSRKAPLSAQVTNTPLNLAWPRGVVSLSHIALPFPPDDPLYGQRDPEHEDIVFLGELALRGERDLLKLPGGWRLRLRYNPFYVVLETRVLEWTDVAHP